MALSNTAVTSEHLTASTATPQVASTTTAFSPSAGSTVVVRLSWLQGGGGTATTITITDNHGNTYSVALAAPNAFNVAGSVIAYHYYASAPGSTTLTISSSASNANTSGIEFEVSPSIVTGAGATPTWGPNTINVAPSGNTTTLVTNLTTTQAGSLVYLAGGIESGSTGTPNANTTQTDSYNGFNNAFTGISTNATVTPGSTPFGWTVSPAAAFGGNMIGAELLPAASGNNVTSGVLELGNGVATLSGTLTNPIRVTSGTLELGNGVAGLSGSLVNAPPRSLSGSMNLNAAGLDGTLTNPIRITSGALDLGDGRMNLSGSLVNAPPRDVTSGVLDLSTASLTGTLHNDGPPTAQISGTGNVTPAGAVVAVPGASAGLSGTGDVAASGTVLVVGATVALSGTGAIAAVGVAALFGSVVMSGTADLSAAPEAIEGLFINGQDILLCGQSFTADLSSAVSVPAKRTANVTVPGKHGSVRVQRKLYAPAQITMTIWVRGANADGTFPPRGQRDQQFYENLDALLRLFSGDVTLTHVTPAKDTRVITGEVLDAIDFTRYAWTTQSAGKIGVTIACWNPFWRSDFPLSASIESVSAPVTQQLTAFATSTGPIEDATVVFNGPCTDPRLESGPWFMQYNGTIEAGQSLTIDVGNWTLTGDGFTPDYGALVHAGLGPWFVMEPAAGGPSVTYSHNGTGDDSTCTVTALLSFLGG